jgi:hypothetical protein
VVRTHPQHIKVVIHLICVWHWCVSHLELVYSFNVNTTTLWFAPRKTPRILVNVQTLLADKNDSSMVRTHPHAHPQHMKIVIHHICAWHWCGSHFEWVYSLKDVLKLRLWFAPQKTTRILNSKWFYNESCGIVVRTYPYTHPQELKVVTHLICIWYWCLSHLEWVYSLNLNSEFQMFLQWDLWYCGKDLSIYTSTATEGCNTPYMHLILMFEPSWMGL